MKIAADRKVSSPLQGQVLRRSERREVAIFLLDDTLWVADFVDGQGELVDAITWFRFNCAAASAQARRRMGLESALPTNWSLESRGCIDLAQNERVDGARRSEGNKRGESDELKSALELMLSD
jgi:hypothetical protein